MGEAFDPIGKQCHLKSNTRVADGTTHTIQETLLIKRIGDSLGKIAYYVKTESDTTIMVFPDEIEII